MRFVRSIIISGIAFSSIALTASAADSCAPYKCADGTEAARCSAEGYPINYFVAPCMMHGGETGEVTTSFSDVMPDDLYAEAIAYVKKEGIVSGYADGTFRPGQTINRAELVKIIVESFLDEGDVDCGLTWDTDTNHPMWDVTKHDWFVNYVCRAYMEGIITGYSDGSFKPAANVNFVEAAKIIVNGVGMRTSADVLWYKPYVEVLEMERAIPMSIIRFDQPITRGEMAEIIWRLLEPDPRRESQSYESIANGDALIKGEVVSLDFSHPQIWGKVEHDPSPAQPGNETFIFSDLYRRNIHPIGANESIYIYTRAYDEDANRYEDVCSGVVDLCDTMIKSDMYTQKSDLEAKATVNIAGYPATYVERYDPPSGYISRLYTFFTPDHRVEISVGYDIGDLYTAEYEQRSQSGNFASLSELVAEDIGENFDDPYNRIVKLYPAQTTDMVKFFGQTDAWVASMRY